MNTGITANDVKDRLQKVLSAGNIQPDAARRCVIIEGGISTFITELERGAFAPAAQAAPATGTATPAKSDDAALKKEWDRLSETDKAKYLGDFDTFAAYQRNKHLVRGVR